MIAIIGSTRLRGSGPEADVAGLAAAIAVAAAAAGSRVELIGKTGDDPAGDQILLALTRRHVGHVATLRDPARSTVVVPDEDETTDVDGAEGPEGVDGAEGAQGDGTSAPPSRASADGPTLEAADVGLALRYLPELGVIVTVHAAPDVLDEAAEAASWAETSMIVVVTPADEAPTGIPDGSVVVALADEDDIGAGAGEALGRYAAALDQGAPAAEAYDQLMAAAAS